MPEKSVIIVINKKYLDKLNAEWKARCLKRGTFVNDNTYHPSVQYFNNSLKDVMSACRCQFGTDPDDIKQEIQWNYDFEG
jgi:hypothetical protein